jgi:hypothetical protein
MRNRGLLSALLVIAFLSGCATTYRTDYHTYLLESEPKSLHFNDAVLAFEFQPVPNGIWFKIENQSETPGFLIWDRCYFIAPNGNSFKALNIDLLDENEETRAKATNESILPPKAIFSRFTTSILNLGELSTLNITGISNYFPGTGFHVSVSEMNRFYRIGRYWPDLYDIYWDSLGVRDVKRPGSLLADEVLAGIISYAINNDKMALGMCIRIGETLYDYRFDFRFDKIEVHQVKGKKEKLIAASSHSDSWKWTFIE